MEIYKNIFPHNKTETGTMYTLKEDVTDNVKVSIKMHVPDGYVEPAPIGFFSQDYDKDDFVSFCKTLEEKKHELKSEPQRDDADLFKFLLEHLDRIDEVAHDVGILDNNSRLLVHGLYHKVIKFQTRLDGLFYSDSTESKYHKGNLLMSATGSNIFMITGLEQEIEFGGAIIHVTKEELLPVCKLATCFMSLYTHASEKLVTCYSIDYKIIRLLSNDYILNVGRFSFSSGMCHELSTMVGKPGLKRKSLVSPKNQVIDITKYRQDFHIGHANGPLKNICSKLFSPLFERLFPPRLILSNQSIKGRTYEEIFNGLMYDSTDFKIRQLCMQTMPCQHYVYTNGVWNLLGGRRIKQLLKERKLKNHSCYSHFKYY
jgi:hypothetical protein